jgi:hypothetical protein
LEKEFGECQRSTQYEGKSGREKRQGNLEKTQLNLEKIRTTDRKMENVFGEAKRLIMPMMPMNDLSSPPQLTTCTSKLPMEYN